MLEVDHIIILVESGMDRVCAMFDNRTLNKYGSFFGCAFYLAQGIASSLPHATRMSRKAAKAHRGIIKITVINLMMLFATYLSAVLMFEVEYVIECSFMQHNSFAFLQVVFCTYKSCNLIYVAQSYILARLQGISSNMSAILQQLCCFILQLYVGSIVGTMSAI